MPDPSLEQNAQDPSHESAGTFLGPSDGRTQLEPGTSAENQVPAGVAPPAAARVLEWFWLSRAMRNARVREGSLLTPRGEELLRRARQTAELARRTLEPSEVFQNGTGEAIACELYREAIEWALAAQWERTGSGASTPPDLASLWDAADPRVLADVARAADTPSTLREDLIGRTYRGFAELAPLDQARIAQSSRAFAEALIANLDGAQTEIDRLWFKRCFRLALVGLGVGLLGLVVGKITRVSEARGDLAAGVHWKASSTYGSEPGCRSPARECAESPDFFVHTNEEVNPWIVFDLGAPRKISGIRVENRLDCCQARAIPLVVEISKDEKSWTEVAHRTKDFTSWKGTFSTAEARFVRLRILKRTNLHFSRVRLLP